MRDAAVAKARLGMAATGLPIGIASEGSYGPHPHVPSTAGGIEIMVLVDDTRGIVVSEVLVEDTPIYDHAFAATMDELGPYFDRTGFPDQALIVNSSEARIEAGPIYKSLRCKDDLAQANPALVPGDRRRVALHRPRQADAERLLRELHVWTAPALQGSR